MFQPHFTLHSEPSFDRFKVFKCFKTTASDEFILVAAENKIEASEMVEPDYACDDGFDEPEEIPAFYSPVKGVLFLTPVILD